MINDETILEYWQQKETINKKYSPFLLIKNYLGYVISIENKAMIIYTNICLYKEDFASFRYIAAIKALTTYTQNRDKYKHSLGRHFVRIYKSEVRDYCKKMITKNSQVLNYAMSYSKDEFLINTSPCNSDIHAKISDINIIKNTIAGNKKLTKLEYDIFLDKVRGYKSNELAQKYSLKNNKINYIYNSAIKKLRENYNNMNH